MVRQPTLSFSRSLPDALFSQAKRRAGRQKEYLAEMMDQQLPSHEHGHEDVRDVRDDLAAAEDRGGDGAAAEDRDGDA